MRNVNPLILEAAKLAALTYLRSANHGDKYLFPVTLARGDGKKNSKVLALAVISREHLIADIESDKAINSGYLQVKDGVLKVAKVSETALRKAFGSHVSFIRPGWDEHTYSDLPFDPSPCAGPRARTFEKRAAKAVGARWCGALHNVQVDGVIKFYDEDGNEVKVRYEVKGLGGRLTAFVPSEVDPDIPERG